MVDALREIHRVLASGGTLIDARPDSRIPAYVERSRGRSFQRFGVVNTNPVELANDRAADRAIAVVLGESLFTSQRRGRFSHLVRFTGLAAVREYLADHLRLVHRPRWTVDAETRRRYASDAFVVRRGVRFDVLERLDG